MAPTPQPHRVDDARLGRPGLLDNDALLYSVVDYGRFHARLPLGPAAVVYGNSAGTYSILLGMLVIGLFPDGRGLSRP